MLPMSLLLCTTAADTQNAKWGRPINDRQNQGAWNALQTYVSPPMYLEYVIKYYRKTCSQLIILTIVVLPIARCTSINKSFNSLPSVFVMAIKCQYSLNKPQNATQKEIFCDIQLEELLMQYVLVFNIFCISPYIFRHTSISLILTTKLIRKRIYLSILPTISLD